MANNRTLDNQLREKFLECVMDFFQKNGEDVLRSNSNECVFPCLDSEGNEKWIQIVVKVPTGGRDGEGFLLLGIRNDVFAVCITLEAYGNRVASRILDGFLVKLVGYTVAVDNVG